jgi:hypothetical protein
MYTTFYRKKIRINNDSYGEVMFNIGIKQECPLPPHIVGMCIDELEKYLDEVDGDSLCLLDMMVAILLYVDNVVLLSRSEASLQTTLMYLKAIF